MGEPVEAKLCTVDNVNATSTGPAVIEPGPRGNLSHELAQQVRARIVDGRLAPGARINEVHLSAEFGVSRTPLREALTRLASEGAVESIPRRGFFVRELTEEELEDIYDIRPLLDPQALRMSGLPSKDELVALEKLNGDLRQAKSVAQAIELDDAWHLRLVAGCGNRVLLELIEQFMARTRRYEMALMDASVNVQAACETHARILERLSGGDLDEACSLLEHNLRTGKEPILTWLRARKP